MNLEQKHSLDKIAAASQRKVAMGSRMRYIAPFTFTTFAAMGCAIFYWFITPVFLDTKPPVVYTKIEPLALEVMQGKPLRMMTTAFKSREDCETDMSSRIIQDHTGKRHVVAEYATEGALPLGRSTTERIITIPPLVAPGPVDYILTTKYYCNWAQRMFGAVVVNAPIVHFTVLANPDQLSTIEETQL